MLSLLDMEDLAIACRDAAGNSETDQRRFVWRGEVAMQEASRLRITVTEWPAHLPAPAAR